ncbi:MAG: tRNA adenosine(34) deaminase TadA [Deltaproteobacteria bacterium]|nr:tRNA adenosine(34) deaminase TadA [Deltaproteobacteria bacterium]MBI3017663.1 tRNA adenosine(34) deaminase TadA [Deltaproteobacteria bacterium]
MDSSDIYFLKKALAQAEKAYAQEEVPIGAILVSKNRIISEGFNLREAQNDPTAHAEIIALQKASQKLKSWRLEGTTLYVTCEPCLMCAGALVQARIERLVYGCADPKAGAVSSLYQTLQDSRLNHQIIVQGGVLEEECRELLQKFFKLRRGVRVAEGARLESV